MNSAEMLDAWAKLERKHLFNVVLAVVFLLFLIGLNVQGHMLNPYNLFTMVYGSFFLTLVNIAIFVYLTSTILRVYLAIRGVRKKLQSGEQIDHTQPWRKRRRRAFYVKGIVILLAF